MFDGELRSGKMLLALLVYENYGHFVRDHSLFLFFVCAFSGTYNNIPGGCGNMLML